MKRLVPYLAVVMAMITLSGCGDPETGQLRDGDLIFQTSRSAQSAAIQKATHSKYSHMGIIFFQEGTPYVYEALQTVQFTPLKQWISRGEGGHYVVKRLQEANRILTAEGIIKIRKAAETFQGRPYDSTFEWSDDRIYCSELVWKIYDRGLGVRIGRLQKLGDFDLSDPAVKKMIKERYGNNVPLNENVISPSEMFTSRILKSIKNR